MIESKDKPKPPKWADDLLCWFCSPDLIEETQGDLYEAFYRRVKQFGPTRAKLLFVRDVVKSMSFKTIDFSFLIPQNSLSMLRNYVTLTFRNLLRQKVFSLINIFGLAIGMASVFLIMEYLRFEWSYDSFFKDHDRIYRVVLRTQTPNEILNVATNHPGAGPALKAEYPEVEDYARLLPQSHRMGNIVSLSYTDENGEQKSFFEDHIYVVDPSFLTVLQYPIKYGKRADALTDPHSIVLTESAAKKYFGSENALGKSMTVDGVVPYKVTAVLEDIPANSHMKFDILVSTWIVETIQGRYDAEEHWKWAEFYSYVRLAPNVDVKAFQEKLRGFYGRHNRAFLKTNNNQEDVVLQPLTDIHLKSDGISNERDVRGNQKTIYFLIVIAALILVIAWSNYINLSTSQSLRRAREVGLRKVVGALKRQLITQFLFESMAVNGFAITLSFLFTALAFPYFSRLTGIGMGSSLADIGLIYEPIFWFAVLAILFAGSFLAGFYPAFMLSSFRIVNALKGNLLSGSGIPMRKVLVTIQFVISVALIGGTILSFRQVAFMRNHELGFARNQLMVIKPPRAVDSTYWGRLVTFREEVRRDHHVKNITSSSEIPGALISNRNGIRRHDQGPESSKTVYMYFVDPDFIPTYSMNVLAGRNFNDKDKLISHTAKSNPIILNRKIIEALGYKTPEEAINQLVTFGLGVYDWTGEIVGVVENFSQLSLKNDYEYMIMFPSVFPQYFTVNLELDNLQETLAALRKQYELSFPGNPFDYFFLDDYFNRQYMADQQFGKVLGLFTGLALIISGLGLYGLTIFMVSQRTKELALRLILGASLQNLITLFSKDFVRLIIISNVIALPVVYFLADKWLSGFAFRISIGWMVFVVPILTLLTISLTTISFQTIITGTRSPIKSLRSE